MSTCTHAVFINANTMRRERNRHCFKSIQLKFSFSLPSLLNLRPSLRAAMTKQSVRKACVIIHVQSVHNKILLLETHCLNLLSLLQLPNETKWTDNISLLFMVFYIIVSNVIKRVQWCYWENLEQYMLLYNLNAACGSCYLLHSLKLFL